MSETTKRCQVEMYDGKLCDRELYDGKHCIFHSKSNDKDAKEFQCRFDDIIKRALPKHYDFTGFVFPESFSFPKNLQRSVIFVGAVFNGVADFSTTDFEGDVDFSLVMFKRKVGFTKAIFRGEDRFLETQFTDDADFDGSTFEGRSSFASATFNGNGQFIGCTFKQTANLHAVYFKNISDFSRTIFQAEAQFWEAEFKDDSHFDQASFKREAEFWEAGFKGRCRFDFACFEGKAVFEGARFERHAHFEGARFEGEANFWADKSRESACFSSAIFYDALIMSRGTRTGRGSTGDVDFRVVKLLDPAKVLFQKLDLSRFRFVETDLRGVHFTDVEWYREKGKGRYKVFDEVSPDPYFKEFDYALIRQLYRRLRANYEDNLLYSEAGDFYIGEMEMRRKGETSILKKLPILIYKVISNYGESYYRPLCWIAAMLVLFPLLFMFANIQPVSLDPTNPVGDVINYRLNFSSIESFTPTWEKLRDYYSCFLYSMSVFSFIRDKKYTTIDNWGHTLFVLESILSPVTLAFFLLALRRRFKR